MKVIIPPEEYELRGNDISCFLAGGITGCPEWQEEVTHILECNDAPDELVIFNPRRPEFNPDVDSAKEQIEWEFKYLNQVDIFSMFFCKESIQPICLYELGRYIEVMKRRFPEDYWMRIIVSVDPEYPRALDVVEQVKLAFDSKPPMLWVFSSSTELHVKAISMAARSLMERKTGV